MGHKKPAYSFGSRFKISEKVCSPGPVYFVKDEITRVGKEGSAKYTQLGRRKESRAFKTPGPGRYENHRCHPQGEIHFPKYSMGSRTKYRKCCISSGKFLLVAATDWPKDSIKT